MPHPDAVRPDPDIARRMAAQIVRIVDQVQIDNLAEFQVDARDASADVVSRSGGKPNPVPEYSLRVTVVVPITRAQYIAITTPNDLQLLRADDVVAWPYSLVHEYRRQYEQKMRLPNPPLLIHPDHAEMIWTAANGPLPERKN